MQLPGHAFSSLMSDFARLMDQDVEASSEGFEFETEGVTVRLMPHPSDPQLGLLESDVQTLSSEDQGDARLLLMLHQLNETSSWAIDWVAMVDLGGQLLLRRTLSLEGMGTRELQEHLLEALDRAQALKRLLVDRLADPEPSAAALAFDPGMQRV